MALDRAGRQSAGPPAPKSTRPQSRAPLNRVRSHLRKADPVLARLIDARPTFDPQEWLAELPTMDPAVIDPVGAPLEAMTECLDGGGDAPRLADRIYALGIERRSAMLLGSALSSRRPTSWPRWLLPAGSPFRAGSWWCWRAKDSPTTPPR